MTKINAKKDNNDEYCDCSPPIYGALVRVDLMKIAYRRAEVKKPRGELCGIFMPDGYPLCILARSPIIDQLAEEQLRSSTRKRQIFALCRSSKKRGTPGPENKKLGLPRLTWGSGPECKYTGFTHG